MGYMNDHFFRSTK